MVMRQSSNRGQFVSMALRNHEVHGKVLIFSIAITLDNVTNESRMSFDLIGLQFYSYPCSACELGKHVLT